MRRATSSFCGPQLIVRWLARKWLLPNPETESVQAGTRWLIGSACSIVATLNHRRGDNCEVPRFLDISTPEHPGNESSLMEIDVIVDYGSGSWALEVTAFSVAIAWLYTHTNVLLAMLMHSAINNTKDIVPSCTTSATNALSLHASLVMYITTALLWVAAAYFLVRMPDWASQA